MPTYDNMIPQPTDILSDSQDDLLQNFQVLATAFAVNHGPYNEMAPFPQGSHTEVTLPNNNAPDPTPIATANIWSAQSGFTNTTELFWQRENNGTVIPFTAFLANNTGWTRLPSGILLKWGFPGVTGLNQPIVFPVSGIIPPFANIFQVLTTLQVISGIRVSSNVISGSIITTGFNVDVINMVTGAGATAIVSYLAIGV